MWRSKSAGVSARIRTFHSRALESQQRCLFATETQAQGAATSQALPPKQTPPPPPPPPKKSGVLSQILGLSVVGLGGLVAYAWYDESFRKSLETKVPFTKSALDAVFVYLPDSPTVPAPIQRERTPRQEVKELTPDNTPPPPLASLKGPTQSPPKPASSPAPVSPSSPPPPAEPYVPSPPPVEETSKEKEPSKPVEPKHEVLVVQKETASERRAREKEEARKRVQQKEAEDKAENETLEVILDNLMEGSRAAVSEALKGQTQLIEQTKHYTELLKKAMDDAVEDLDKDFQWQSVNTAAEERDFTLQSIESVVAAARESVEKLNKAVEESRQNKVTRRNQALSDAKKVATQLSNELNKMQSQVSKAEGESRVLLKYRDLTDRAKKQFKKELESITPDMKLGDCKGKLSEEELNSLIMHAHRRIEQLQKQLARQIAEEQQTVQQALVDQQIEDEKLAEERIRQEREKFKEDLRSEREKWEVEAQVNLERELRHQKSRDAAAHSDHLQAVIAQSEKQMEKQYQRLLHKKLLIERNEFHRELMDWVARVKGIEAAVEARAESEKVAQQAQELWMACIALNASIKVGQEGGTPEQQLKPLAKQLETVTNAASCHPYVQAVLRAIPDIAITRGVWSEENLKERFTKVRRVAKRVAMIDESGGSLAKYFLSYLQSFLIFNSVYAKDSNDEVDLEELDNFQILNHANYWIQRGDLEQALRFMNQLRGESRRVAEDWINETRLHLEAVQAAQALMAFASASGLGTLF